jgi:hypothetical protein
MIDSREAFLFNGMYTVNVSGLHYKDLQRKRPFPSSDPDVTCNVISFIWDGHSEIICEKSIDRARVVELEIP